MPGFFYPDKVSQSKKYFFGKFCKRNKWMIPSKDIQFLTHFFVAQLKIVTYILTFWFIFNDFL